jgi:hypothetical protein
MTYTRTGDESRGMQPRGPAQVEVFTTGAPARPHLEMGFIDADRDGHDVIAQMREYAGKLGCDALVMHEGGEVTSALRGSCLVYTAPPLLPPPPQPTAATSTAAVSCIPNASQPCYGAGGCSGTQTCSPDGKSFSGCSCAAPSGP